MCLFWLLFVFFFKQKTAYEMRISDWSSDVCSSDLFEDAAGYVERLLVAVFEYHPHLTRLEAGDQRRVARRDTQLTHLAGGDHHRHHTVKDFFPGADDVATDCACHLLPHLAGCRSEERREGKECVSTCRSRWAPYL